MPAHIVVEHEEALGCSGVALDHMVGRERGCLTCDTLGIDNTEQEFDEGHRPSL
jgi:hypothetical protein